MKLENVKINDLKPLENNVRKHSEKQIEELVRSVKQFGQTRAMVIDEDNNILIGNGLYYALVQLGEKEAQCYRKTGLSEKDKKKLILTDNKVFQLGSDDYNAINEYINEITSFGDFDIAGYDKFVLEQMTASDEETEEAIKSYGTITDVKLTEEVPEVTRNNVEEEDTPVPATIVTETKVGGEKQERKYIICPSCGEMIYLD